jgi:rubredoxin
MTALYVSGKCPLCGTDSNPVILPSKDGGVGPVAWCYCPECKHRLWTAGPHDFTMLRCGNCGNIFSELK